MMQLEAINNKISRYNANVQKANVLLYTSNN